MTAANGGGWTLRYNRQAARFGTPSHPMRIALRTRALDHEVAHTVGLRYLIQKRIDLVTVGRDSLQRFASLLVVAEVRKKIVFVTLH